jgi:hypothetical protein
MMESLDTPGPGIPDLEHTRIQDRGRWVFGRGEGRRGVVGVEVSPGLAKLEHKMWWVAGLRTTRCSGLSVD